MVYVLDINGKPLMPTGRYGKVKHLLKDGKAKVVKRCPFTIKLTYQTDNYTQNLTLGIDTGSSKIGSAVVKENGDIVYLSETEIRNDIKDKMDARRRYRRSRRNKKTRYRKSRWLNRKNSIKKDRFSPTMTSKINSHVKEIEFVKSILPIKNIILETGNFDVHALKNPVVLKNKRLYQKGINYGFSNTKSYVLDRDNYTCQHCKGKSKDSKLEVHHIIFRRNGGSDEENNLICLCKSCHDKLHRGEISLNKKGKIKGQLKHATQMNSIRVQLLKIYSAAKETFGYITKEHRQLMSLPKEHYNDAIVIASLNNIEDTGCLNTKYLIDNIIYKKCIPDGDFQQTKGVRSQQVIPTGKIQGFRKFDKVRYLGKEYFIKGRMSSGYAILMDIEGNKIDFSGMSKGFKTSKLNNCKRIQARNSWMIMQKNIA